MPSHRRSKEDDCLCERCKRRRQFTIPEHILSECRAGRLAFFAGAGASTEGFGVLPRTFYADICESLGIDTTSGMSFPDVMTEFVKQPNGRRLLLRKIRDRFAYVESFSEIYQTATSFHQEMATLHLVDVIVTTNWDDFFERECGATPFVGAEDFAFWDLPGRKVFKLHGSANNYGSLVATRADYEKSFDALRTGLVGANLKLMLATKTIVYVGFSFRDDDFVRLHDLLSREMQGLRPQSYIVTLDRESDDRFREHGLIPIYTDATHFVECVKGELIERGDMLPDEIYLDIPRLIRRVVDAHLAVASEIDLKLHPEAMYTLFYQDGLHHALERIMTLRKTGYYSHACNPQDVVRSYEALRKTALRSRKYAEVAYIEGYINGHIAFMASGDVRAHLPKFFLFGYEGRMRSLAAYVRQLRRASSLHKTSSRLARSFVEERFSGEPIVLHHPPWL